MLRKSQFFAATLLALGSLGSLPAQANLVTNGGFETGDFTGWGNGFNAVWDGVDGLAPQSGSFAAFFGNPGGISTISQSLSTVAGTLYSISFWLQNEADVTGNAVPNSFEFDWDGVTQMSLTNAPGSGYTEYTFQLVASGATTNLAFNFSQTAAFWDFDSVVVEAATVPEPGSLPLLAVGGVLAFATLRARKNS